MTAALSKPMLDALARVPDEWMLCAQLVRENPDIKTDVWAFLTVRYLIERPYTTGGPGLSEYYTRRTPAGRSALAAAKESGR